MRLLSILQVYIRVSFLQWMAWRSFAFTLVANQAVTPLIGLAVWSTALPSESRLPLYYFVLLVVRLMTVSYENHTFSGRIYSGELADHLLRPHPVVLQPLGDNVSIRIWHMLIGAPLLLVVLLFLPAAEMKLWPVLAALPALVLAAGIQFLFTFSLAMTAFWTERAHAVVHLGSTLIFLLGGVAVPISLMPGVLLPFVELLPFRYMMAFPAEIVADAMTLEQLGFGYVIQLVWLLIFGWVSRRLWRSGVRRYTVVGG